MSQADVVAAVLWVAASLYAVFGGADFGAGLWDLVAGGAERGRGPRGLMDRAITPVWEANHVWLIFLLVVMWTAFPEAFAAIMSTLFVPLCLAALGIVLRGSGFAFRKMVASVSKQRVFGALFALSSVITPFFLGAAVGAVATGRVPADDSGDRLTSWLNWPSVTIGVLFVVICAYLAAVFLISDARRVGDRALERYFRLRALGAAAVAGVVAVIALLVLRADNRAFFDALVGDGLPAVLLSALAGLAALALVAHGTIRGTRVLASAAVVAVVWGWGLAQFPDLLPGSLTIAQAAAPSPTMVTLFVVFGVAAIWIVPALGLLYTLHDRSLLGEPDEPAEPAG